MPSRGMRRNVAFGGSAVALSRYLKFAVQAVEWATRPPTTVVLTVPL